MAKGLMPYESALKALLDSAISRTLGAETVPLEKAMGRILVGDVHSDEELPSFDNSAMDGFCVLSSDTAGASGDRPVWLPSLGIIAAGDLHPDLRRSEAGPACIEIMTGATMPESNYDAVARIEDVRVERDAEGRAIRVGFGKPVEKGENVRLRGTDLRIGEKVLPSGLRLSPHHVLSCAALGISEVEVRRKPRIAIVSTGSELVPMDTGVLPRGMIRNSTGVFASALFTEFGADCRFFGIVRDDPKEYRDLLRRLQDESYDVVISTGAVSMGKFDFVSDVLHELGARTSFHKAAIRPGKPILFAELDGSRGKMAFFGMPGNPVSTAVGCRFFLVPYLRGILGLEAETPIRAKLASTVGKPSALRCFHKARVSFAGGEIAVESLKSQASYVVSSLTAANAWLVLREGADRVAEGTLVDVYPLSHGGGIEQMGEGIK